jgi:spore coat polysaccharide biosynthesis protein SpsF (cytidylyltransferase family)
LPWKSVAWEAWGDRRRRHPGTHGIDAVSDRARRARCVDRVVVATTTKDRDDTIVEVATALGVDHVRGPEDDVLRRMVIAADHAGATVVVRITADCPLLDPRLIDRVVGRLVRDDAEYACDVIPPSYPDGYDVEALTISCLRRLDIEATLAYEREHVTARAREHPELYRQALVVCRRDLSALRLTVDTPADLARISRLLELIPRGSTPGLGAILAALRLDPSLWDSAGLPTRDEHYHGQRVAAALDGDA